MEKVTQSVHHEGIAILARSARSGDTSELLERLQTDPCPLLILDGVQNPHNIGTIMRIMASFGWPVLVGPGDLPPLSGAAARMSAGGAMYVKVFVSPKLSDFIKQLKELDYRVVGASNHAEKSIYECEIPKRTAWVLGSEVHGISSAVARLLDQECVIPSSGQVESLNVAVACGLLLGEYTRQHGLGPQKPS